MRNFNFTNRYQNNLAGDTNQDRAPRRVLSAFWSPAKPKLSPNPKLIAYSDSVAKSLDLTSADCNSQDFLNIFSGNKILANTNPFAMNYAGHQFGNWAGQLGDGRVINLGEINNSQAKFLTLQLKGAGLTPYSRTADGKAVLRSSLREFLCSEAMHYLGVPTTRALCLIATGEEVIRDMFYDGRPKLEPGAITTRVAPSFIRFGHFQLAASQQNLPMLRQLFDFCITADFNQLADLANDEQIITWFNQIAQTTIKLVINWQRVGFVHGVLNTDNMSILGLTIDYGPYGFLENYNPKWTPNTTDADGRRYCFGQQAYIAQWNLLQLASAILPLANNKSQLADSLQQILNDFAKQYQQQYLQMMLLKLGLDSSQPKDDKKFIELLLTAIHKAEIDFTLFFNKLNDLSVTQINAAPVLGDFIELSYLDLTKPVNKPDTKLLIKWLNEYFVKISQQQTPLPASQLNMHKVNPKFILRNYLTHQAIELAGKEDYSMVNELLEVLQNPYQISAKHQHFIAKRPDWAKTKAGCSMLSCSS